MPLTGEAKAAYQRDYMRKRRAADRQAKAAPGQPAAAGREADLEAALFSEREARRRVEAELAGERRARLAAELAPVRPAPTPTPPVDPESALAKAKATVGELRWQLRSLVKERDRLQQLLHGAGLSKATLNAVRKALHGDHAAHSTAESREAALAMLNAELDQHGKRFRH